MEERELILKTADWLQDRWGVILPDDPSSYDSREELVGYLIPRLQYLVGHDLEYLVNSMYRLDISESKFHAAMAAGSPGEIARQLAGVVLEREIQRMKTRILYSKRRAEEE